MIHNTFRAADTEDLGAFKPHPDAFHIVNYCAGPLLPGPSKISAKNLVLQDKVKNWLRDKPARSVLYVSFRSMASPLAIQITEIGNALLKLGNVSFLAERNKSIFRYTSKLRRKPTSTILVASLWLFRGCRKS